MKMTGFLRRILKALSFIIMMSVMMETAQAQEKIRIKLNYYNVDGVKILKAKVITKIDRVYVPVPNVVVHFYNNEEIDDFILAQTTTEQNGEAQCELKSNLAMSVDSTFIFYASVKDNPEYIDKSIKIEVKEAIFSLKCELIDSVKTVTVTMQDMLKRPEADVQIKLYVKRLFGLLSIGEDYLTTNNKGQVKIEFPNDIPGDENGAIELVAKVEDSDDFGNLEIHQQVKWGVPLTALITKNERALWANRDNAPVYLVMVANVIIFGIWFVILYIIYQVFLLNKIGKQET